MLRVEAGYFGLSALVTMVWSAAISGTTASGDTNFTPAKKALLSAMLSMAVAAMSVAGAKSVGRGDAWKTAVVVVAAFYALAALVFGVLAAMVPAGSAPIPPVLAAAGLAVAVAILIGGMGWCWAKAAGAARAGRADADSGGPRPAVFGLVVSVPAKVLLLAVPLMLLAANRAAVTDARCLYNLQQLGLAALMYSNVYRNQLPPTHRVGQGGPLWEYYYRSAAFEQCPGTGDGHVGAGAYMYLLDHVRSTLPPATGWRDPALRTFRASEISRPAAVPLFWDDQPRHANRRGVIFLDGRADLMPEDEFQKTLAGAVKEVAPLLR
jgi:hypothetical protein